MRWFDDGVETNFINWETGRPNDHNGNYEVAPVCECNAGGFRLISNHLPTGFEGKFAGHFTKITSCEEPCTLNYGLLPCTGYFYEPNNYGKCTLFFYHGVNTNIQSSPDGTASLYVKCDQVSLEECTASLRENIVATTTHSSGGAANGTTVVGATGVTESGFKEELVMTTDMGEDPILLFLSYNTIYQYDRSANRTLKLLDNLKNAISMDYWLKDSINVMDLNTKQRKVLFKKKIEIRQDIAVDPSKGLIFWTDDYNNVIERASMDGNDRMLISGLYNLRTVRVYHNAAQPELPNKCDQHTCGNGAICLPKSNSFDNEGKPQPRIGLPYSCVCADGYTTGKEPNTCVLII
uniref:Apple domain-containing protein n=1 Tax=Acrobeloides nanus TaxID=290746 RepID=A0A914DJ24_9BILA